MNAMGKFFLAGVLVVTFLPVVSFAGRGPDYACQKRVQACEKACDEQAESSKNARNYQKCLDRCREMSKSCNDRQKVADRCAESFRKCSRNAHSQSDKEKCRSAYRSCKGHN